MGQCEYVEQRKRRDLLPQQQQQQAERTQDLLQNSSPSMLCVISKCHLHFSVPNQSPVFKGSINGIALVLMKFFTITKYEKETCSSDFLAESSDMACRSFEMHGIQLFFDNSETNTNAYLFFNRTVELYY